MGNDDDQSPPLSALPGLASGQGVLRVLFEYPDAPTRAFYERTVPELRLDGWLTPTAGWSAVSTQLTAGSHRVAVELSVNDHKRVGAAEREVTVAADAETVVVYRPAKSMLSPGELLLPGEPPAEVPISKIGVVFVAVCAVGIVAFILWIILR